MKQRTVTIISTLLNPRLLIADEPTSALDVSSQKALCDMLLEMLEQRIMYGVIFVTHDLPVLREVSNRIAVMYAGKIIEIGGAIELTERPRHPYSAALLGSVLSPSRGTGRFGSRNPVHCPTWPTRRPVAGSIRGAASRIRSATPRNHRT